MLADILAQEVQLYVDTQRLTCCPVVWPLYGEIEVLLQEEVLDRRFWASWYAVMMQPSRVRLEFQGSLHEVWLCVSRTSKMTECWRWVRLR